MICLDTTVIIDFLNNRKEAVSLIEQNQENLLMTTEITVLEVFFGIYIKRNPSKEEEDKVREFFNSLDILPMKKSSGKLTAKILSDLSKKGTKLEQNDALIAATMLKNGCNTIITKNKKHFSRIKGLKVISY